jgi:hypothetical protein
MRAVSKDEAMDALLRRNLAGAPQADKSDCPGPEILAAYFEHSLSIDEIANCETHFGVCARCREQLAAMVRAEEAPDPAHERMPMWDWRWLAATAAVLALAATLTWRVGVALQPAQVRKNTEAPFVAQARTGQEPPAAVPGPAPASPAPPEAQGAAPTRERESSSARDETRSNKIQTNEAPATDAVDKKQLSAPESPANQRDAAESGLPGKAAEKPSVEAPQRTRPQPAAGAIVGGVIGGAVSTQNAPAANPSLQQQPDLPANTSAPPSGPTIAGNSGNSAGSTAPLHSDALTRSARASNATPPAGDAQAKAYSSTARAHTAEQRSGAILIRTPDAKILWRITGGGFIERTVDGGATWEGEQLPDVNAELTAGSAPSAKVCWLVGSAGAILLTKDATNWQKIAPPIPADFTAVTAKDATTATISAVDGQKFATRTGGKTWMPIQ